MHFDETLDLRMRLCFRCQVLYGPHLVYADDILRTCLIVAQGDWKRASLAVSPPSGDARLEHCGLSWDEMFAACKHNAENGLPCDDSQTRWMSEQWRRKEKLDSVGVVWYMACISKPAGASENANEVIVRMKTCYYTSGKVCRISMPRIWHVLTIFGARCSIGVQGELDPLAVESSTNNSPVNRGVERPVRGSFISFEAFVTRPMLRTTLIMHHFICSSPSRNLATPILRLRCAKVRQRMGWIPSLGWRRPGLTFYALHPMKQSSRRTRVLLASTRTM
jgi:hypothetical protein